MGANRKGWFRRAGIGAVVALGAAILPFAAGQLPVYAGAGSPDPVIVSDTAPGPVTWTSDVMVGAYVTTDNAAQCFDSTGRPFNPPNLNGASACEVFTLTVNLSSSTFWSTHTGGVKFHSNEGTNDYDFYVFGKNADGTKGALITAAGAAGGTGGVEDFTIDKAQGSGGCRICDRDEHHGHDHLLRGAIDSQCAPDRDQPSWRFAVPGQPRHLHLTLRASPGDEPAESLEPGRGLQAVRQ